MQLYLLEDFARDMEESVLKIEGASFRSEISAIYGVPRGGLAIALWLSHRLGLPVLVDEADIDSGTLVVDDIADRGYTLSGIKPTFSFTIFYNPNSNFEPDIWLHEKKDEWILFPWETEQSTQEKFS